MDKKRGGGGHPEAFDPNTGKYVADGQPNKYYDNPKEKKYKRPEEIIAPNGKSLVEIFGDIFGEENEKINAMFAYREKKTETFEEKYSKPILEMSQEEHLKEIGEHKEWLLKNNVDLQVKCFDQDLKLKCANFREMHRLFEKYPFFNNLNHKVLINERKMPRRYADCRMVNGNLKTYEGNYGRRRFESAVFSFRDGIRFNSNRFDNYDKIFELESNDIKLKYHPEISENKIANCSFTHEFGHLLASHFIYNQLSDDAKNIEGKLLVGADGLKIFNKIASEWNELENKFHNNAKNEIMQIYLQDNPSLGINDFYNEESDYAKENLAEWFAETFTSMEGGKPTKSALAMEKWLKQKTGN